MSVLEELEDVEVLEESDFSPSSDDLKLSEASQIQEANDDGTVLLNLIRPCVGRGKGKHLYGARMLEANAQKFTGWKMYLNHLSDQARRALGGLPRDIRDTGGIVLESWWNPDVPAEGRYGRGAVQGKVRTVPLIKELIDVDPRLVEASINASATACKPGRVGGERVLIVEGIEEKGSVDWVTEAGAGGQIASLMEAMIEDGSYLAGAMDDLSDGEILAWIGRHRPELVEAMRKPKKAGAGGDGDAEDQEDGGDDELEEMVKSLLDSKKAKTRAQAVALATRALAQKKSGAAGSGKQVSEAARGDGVPDLDREALVEALTSEEGQAAIQEAVTGAIGPAVAAAVRDLDLGSEVVALVTEQVSRDREVIEAAAAARADRQNDLRDMRDYAHHKIEESRLTGLLKERAKARFDLVEGAPTVGLDLVDDEDEAGKVVKSAKEKLDEAVVAEIRGGYAVMAEINPTQVRGLGAGASVLREAEGGEGKEGDEKVDAVGPETRSLLESMHIDPDKAYEHSLPPRIRGES